jgi:hypothetical protein
MAICLFFILEFNIKGCIILKLKIKKIKPPVTCSSRDQGVPVSAGALKD